MCAKKKREERRQTFDKRREVGSVQLEFAVKPFGANELTFCAILFRFNMEKLENAVIRFDLNSSFTIHFQD